MGGDVFYIGRILQTTFNFKAADAGIDQLPQLVRQVEVLQRQEVLIAYQGPAVFGLQVVGLAAGLTAFTTIGAASVQVVTHVALSAVRHTQGPMDKEFERYTGVLADVGNLLQTEFAGQEFEGAA